MHLPAALARDEFQRAGPGNYNCWTCCITLDVHYVLCQQGLLLVGCKQTPRVPAMSCIQRWSAMVESQAWDCCVSCILTFLGVMSLSAVALTSC